MALGNNLVGINLNNVMHCGIYTWANTEELQSHSKDR